MKKIFLGLILLFFILWLSSCEWTKEENKIKSECISNNWSFSEELNHCSCNSWYIKWEDWKCMDEKVFYEKQKEIQDAKIKEEQIKKEQEELLEKQRIEKEKAENMSKLDKTQYKTINYNILKKNVKKHKDEKVKISWRIFTAKENDYYSEFQIFTTDSWTDWQYYVATELKNDFIEWNWVTVWGTIVDEYCYTSTAQREICVPLLKAYVME